MKRDAASIFPYIRKSAEKLGSCDPQWLKTGLRPEIQVSRPDSTSATPEEEAAAMEKAKAFTAKLKEQGAKEWAEK